MSEIELGKDAIKVLAAMANLLPDASGYDPEKVMQESGLQGIDFNLGVEELKTTQKDGYPLVFRARDTKMLKMNPAALKLVREHREHFKTVLAETKAEPEVASVSSAFD